MEYNSISGCGIEGTKLTRVRRLRILGVCGVRAIHIIGDKGDGGVFFRMGSYTIMLMRTIFSTTRDALIYAIMGNSRSSQQCSVKGPRY